jgi:hypothetical protein
LVQNVLSSKGISRDNIDAGERRLKRRLQLMFIGGMYGWSGRRLRGAANGSDQKAPGSDRRIMYLY